jgi:hypothetical protein
VYTLEIAQLQMMFVQEELACGQQGAQLALAITFANWNPK